MAETPEMPEELPLADEAAVITEATTPAREGEAVGPIETAHVPEIAKENEDMIDIHVPEATTHTWKDFWIHLGTITAGLLIAISLEQSVEDYDPSHLTPAQVADEIELTQTLLMQHYRHVLGLRIVGLIDPDFTPAPTQADMDKLSHYPDQQTRELLPPAYALTLERMKAAGYVPYNVTSDEWVAGGTKK